MVDIVMMRTMPDRLKFSAAATTEIVDVEGIDSIEELKELGPDRIRVDKLCSVVQKPGGGAAGNIISEAAHNRLMLAHYYLHHHDRIQRKAITADIKATSVRSLRRQKELEDAYSNEMKTVPTVDMKDPRIGIRCPLELPRIILI